MTTTESKLLHIVANAYQILGALDIPSDILDVLAAPRTATQKQIDAMLPFVQEKQTKLVITKGERDNGWQEFDVNDHYGLIRVVARMEDDKTDLPLGKLVEQLLLRMGK